jgi:hypothetical protein
MSTTAAVAALSPLAMTDESWLLLLSQGPADVCVDHHTEAAHTTATTTQLLPGSISDETTRAAEEGRSSEPPGDGAVQEAEKVEEAAVERRTAQEVLGRPPSSSSANERTRKRRQDEDNSRHQQQQLQDHCESRSEVPNTPNQRSEHPLNNASSEPAPQASPADPLVQYWQSRTADINKSHSHLSAGRELTLAERSIAARRAADEVRAQHQFWSNRLRLLKAEALKIEAKQSQQQTSLKHHHHDRSASPSGGENDEALNVSSLAAQTLSAQLEEGHRREAGIRKERAAAIQLQRTTHTQTLRDARRAMLENRREISRQIRMHSENHESIVEALRADDLAARCKQRDAVQHQKVAMLLKRVRNAAMRAEEAKLLYEEKIQQLTDDQQEQRAAIVGIVQESSKLVQKIRRLRAGGGHDGSSGNSNKVGSHSSTASK